MGVASRTSQTRGEHYSFTEFRVFLDATVDLVIHVGCPIPSLICRTQPSTDIQSTAVFDTLVPALVSDKQCLLMHILTCKYYSMGGLSCTYSS